MFYHIAGIVQLLDNMVLYERGKGAMSAERGKGEETKPPIDTYEFVPKSQYQYKPPLKENKDEDKTESNMSEPVKEEDVTFEETQQETKSSAQIPDEDLDETFKDCRIEDVPTEYSDEDEADVPRAKGKSFEDIDLAVRTVKSQRHPRQKWYRLEKCSKIWMERNCSHG